MRQLLFLLLLLPLQLSGQRSYVGSFLMSHDSAYRVDYDHYYSIKSIPTLHNDTLVVYHLPVTSYYPTVFTFAIHHSRYVEDQVGYSSRWRTNYHRSSYYAVATHESHPYNIKIVRTALYTTMWITPMVFSELHQVTKLRGFCITDDHHLIRSTFPSCYNLNDRLTW